MTSNKTILLAGGSRGVGREIANILSEQLITTIALIRSINQQAELELLGIKVVIGNAINDQQINQIFTNNQPINAIISTIGGLPQEGIRADYLGNKNLIDAAVTIGVDRFILVSSLGAGDTKNAIPSRALEALSNVLIEKEKAEQYLINSGLKYTIIRPGGLKSLPPTDTAILTTDTTVAGSIHRSNVADLVIKCLNSDRAINQTLSAIDRQQIYTQKQFVEFLP